MGFGVSLILIAVGLILALAVNANSSAVDIHTVGWIVTIIGAVGLVLSMIFWNTWAGPGYWSSRPPDDVRRRRPPDHLLIHEHFAGTAGWPSRPRLDAGGEGKLEVEGRALAERRGPPRSTRACARRAREICISRGQCLPLL
jgi:hypothetical protein